MLSVTTLHRHRHDALIRKPLKVRFIFNPCLAARTKFLHLGLVNPNFAEVGVGAHHLIPHRSQTIFRIPIQEVNQRSLSEFRIITAFPGPRFRRRRTGVIKTAG
jgi:hypothetical protein